MPELQPPAPSAAVAPALESRPFPAWDELDFALGCECAHPALQIERWRQEASTDHAG